MALKILRPRNLARLTLAGAAAGGVFLAGLYLGSEVGIGTMKDYVKGVIDPSSRRQLPSGAWKVVPTNLHEVVIERVALPESDRTGGAIEQIGDKLLFATPDGGLGYVTPGTPPVMLKVTIPMNNEGMRQDPIADDPAFDIQYIRVTDLLVQDLGESRYRVLVSHHRYQDGCVNFQVSRVVLKAEGDRLVPQVGDVEPLWVAEPCLGFRPDNEFVFSGHQAGGRLVPHGDGRVLLSVGDHQFDGTHGMPSSMPSSLPPERAFPMDPSISLGKIFLLDPETGNAEIFARGVRNPQGLLRDAAGRIWETEHAPQGGDELNLIQRGNNYGWPEVTLGVEYGTKAWPFNATQGRHDGFTKPRFAWVPSIGVSNLVQADAREFPLWDGDLLVTSLIRMTVFRLRLDGDHVVYVEPFEVGERIRDAIVLDDGRIALYADSADAILLLRNGHTTGADADRVAARGDIEQPDSPGAAVFQANCASCHSLRGDSGVGPHLDGVMGREVGSVRGFNYSAALREARDNWNTDRLARYVRDPQGTYDGSRMAATPLPEGEMEALTAFLEAQTSG